MMLTKMLTFAATNEADFSVSSFQTKLESLSEMLSTN